MFYENLKKLNSKLKKKSSIYRNNRTNQKSNQSKHFRKTKNKTYSQCKASNNFTYKMPILTEIELITTNTDANATSNNEEKSYTSTNEKSTTNKTILLFNDYLLISSRLKYKYLLHNVYEQAKIDEKHNYKILNGKYYILNCYSFN